MADNIPVFPAEGGLPVATDELTLGPNAGAHAQLIKLLHGGDGDGSHMVQDADPLPVVARAAIPTAARLSASPLNVNAAGDTTLLVGTAGQTIRHWKMFLVAAAAVSLKFRSGATDLHPAVPLVAGGSWVLDFDSEPWFVTAVGEALVLNCSAAVQISGRWYYTKS